ncbi:MAG: radical SAM protein [Methylococcaceae bacterium]|nr:radical SAM protein [Methylococcaceae bacterium]
MSQKLSSTDHSRDVAGLKYVYPVISRRAGGLSIGINFNPNNACNWRCIYCQVPDLTKGTAPEMDFALLKSELTYFLDDVLNGDFYQRFNVPKEQQGIKDIAISGNGEPTSLKNFAKAIELIGECAKNAEVFPQANFILISNGSLMHRKEVQQGLAVLNNYQGEVWFKLDSATATGLAQINNTHLSPEKQLTALITAANICPTKLQTCLLNYHHQGLLTTEKQAYLALLTKLKRQVDLKGILLYSLARESHQPESIDLEKMPFEIMTTFADEIRELGFNVNVAA